MIMAGGTGGHVFPGLAVADQLRQQNVSVVWMGTRRGLEARLVPDAGITIEWIAIQGLRKRGILGWLLLPMRVLKAMWQAMRIILRQRPDAVLAMGGFVAGPGALVAWLMRKPLLIHEQNAIPGMTNRLLSLIAKHVLCGFPGAFKNIPRARHVGNPVRDVIAQLPAPEQRMAQARGQIRLLIIGGSQGSRYFNQVVPEAVALLAPKQRPLIRHQCGPRWLDETKASYSKQGVEAELSAFIQDMAQAYTWADLVICRAGAMTVSELAAAGMASILVPYPYAVDDHQSANARYLSERNAALLIPEAELSASRLSEVLQELSNNREVILQMAINARGCAVTDAAQSVAALCQEVMHA